MVTPPILPRLEDTLTPYSRAKGSTLGGLPKPTSAPLWAHDLRGKTDRAGTSGASDRSALFAGAESIRENGTSLSILLGPWFLNETLSWGWKETIREAKV